MTGLLLALLLTLSALFACTPANGEESSQPQPADSSAEESEEPKVPDENAKLVWNELYADEANGIAADHCVTVRERDTMQQVRMLISEVKAYLREKCAF